MGALSWTIGEVKITRVLETEVSMPFTQLFPEASETAIEGHRHWLSPHFINDGYNFNLAIQALLVESCGLRILIDTCIGEHDVPGFPVDSSGTGFLEKLAAEGFDRHSVDIVMCTHLHFDHVGWNTIRDGERWLPTFPNARYLFAEKEWQFWSQCSHSDYTETYEQSIKPVVDAGQVDFVAMNHAITDEVFLRATPGHTIGHVSVCIESGDQRAMITGDMSHHPIQWAEIDWPMSADYNSAQAVDTRRQILDENTDTNVLIIGTHYPFPCAGHLISSGGLRRFRPIDD